VSKRKKRLQRIRQNPKNVSFDELHQLLIDYGFQLDRIRGSHHIFEYEYADEVLTFTIPYGNRVKLFYVKEVLRLIDLVTGDSHEQDD
jgi:predicted RNA binding protein YcfA (HicA-like mRNA interferase family)